MNRLSKALPSPLTTAPLANQPLYLSAPDAVTLVRRLGLQHCIAGMAKNIRADFLRWPDFDKSARVANHSKEGVIELMPISDDKAYSFKYVNGHPHAASEPERASKPPFPQPAAAPSDFCARVA